jgi:phenylalanyl-tRNA synthetase beta chain
MRIPLNWLRDYVDITWSVEELAERLSMAGMDVKGSETVADDVVLELTLPQLHYEQRGDPIEKTVAVEIADADLCSRYCASLISGLKVSTSPSWLQQRLLACGMRPINNIVDVTNYVMMEWGQPLHAFDYAKVQGKRIVVRRARGGEVITTLDGVERELGGDMLVIADVQSPVAIAGVMGGADTEVARETTTVLLESANFNPTSVRRTCAHLPLHTEASLRFEKGISPELPLLALQRATQLLLELAGGQAASGVIDVYPVKVEPKSISFSTAQVKRLLGIDLEIHRIVKVLNSLGFRCESAGLASELLVAVPYWRGDVRLAADLVEEVARIIGYESLPTTMLGSPLPRRQPDPMIPLKERIRDILVACGFQEVVTYSLTSQEMLQRTAPTPAPLRIANPMTREQEYLRTTLRAGLFTTLSSNQKREGSGIRLFEVGKIYLPREGDLPEEREMLVGVLSGPRQELSRLGGMDPLDYFDAKGVVESLLSRLGARAEFEVVADEGLHPGRKTGIILDGDRIGVIGELHPRVRESFDLLGPVYLFEIDVAKLLPHSTRPYRYQTISRFPGVVRDLAIVVDDQLPSQKAQDIIQGFPLVSQVTLFDLYVGPPIPQDKKSLAYRAVFQSPTHTLTDEEVDRVQQEILDRLYRELGAALRSDSK